MLVRDFLEATAERLPEKVALICGTQRFTYAELDAQADRLARALMAHGVGRGDRVVIQLPNCAPAAVAIFATLKAGAVFVPVNASAKAEKLKYILNNCRASALVSELTTGQLPTVASLKVVVSCNNSRTDQLNSTQPQEGIAPSLDFDSIQREWPARRPERANEPADLACLIYTSGSTGQPKGVMCEHRNVVFASGSIIQYLQNTESDIVLGLLPLSFDYGLYQMLMAFRFGGTLVLENSFAFPALILERVAQERVTGLPGVPTLFTLLLGLDFEQYDLSSLRYITNTAAALPPTQIMQLRHRFPRVRLYSMYGLTETKRTLYLPPEELERRPGSVGIPIPGTEAWLEDESRQRVRNGEVGELVVRGPHVMRGYWEDEQATARRFRFLPAASPEVGAEADAEKSRTRTRTSESDNKRLCYTGDLFRQDTEGFFYFVGRKDDIIKSRGEKVAPKEVEEVLHAMPGVAEAAVLGIPDPVLGQAVKAYVVCRGEPLSTARVLAHCRAHLEDFMLPREVEFVDALPKNASGKTDKLALAAKTPAMKDSQREEAALNATRGKGGPGSLNPSARRVKVAEPNLSVASYEKPANTAA
jgi:amino acid adenylation domain-containing protein